MGEMLKDMVAAITGTGNGLGRAYALEFAGQGARVIVNDIGTSADGHGDSNSPADRVVKEIENLGGTAIAGYGSVAVEDEAKKIIQLAVDKFARIDILVNNAGIIRNYSLTDIPAADWDAVVRTHLYGTFFCTRSACGFMKKQSYGRIINTSSHAGFGVPGQAVYSTVKEGIVGFSRTVARGDGAIRNYLQRDTPGCGLARR